MIKNNTEIVLVKILIYWYRKRSINLDIHSSIYPSIHLFIHHAHIYLSPVIMKFISKDFNVSGLSAFLGPYIQVHNMVYFRLCSFHSACTWMTLETFDYIQEEHSIAVDAHWKGKTQWSSAVIPRAWVSHGQTPHSPQTSIMSWLYPLLLWGPWHN